MVKHLHIGFYNLENLFDTEDDPHTHDDDFTPEGKKRWTERRYKKKQRKLSFVIDQMGKDHELAFVGLAEVENKRVIQDLLDAEYLQDDSYKIIHYDSLDERGIDVGFIYNPKHFFPTHQEPIRIPLVNDDGTPDFTRDMLYVAGNLGNELMHIFVVHLPSKRHQDINKSKREHILRELRKRIDLIYAQEKAPHIVVMGDFNENPNHAMIQNNLKTKKTLETLQPNELYNPMENLLEKGEGSLVYKNTWLLFDQMLFSKAFTYAKEKVELEEVAIFDERFLKKWEGDEAGFPFRTYVGKRFQNGYSDHFPVYAKIKLD